MALDREHMAFVEAFLKDPPWNHPGPYRVKELSELLGCSQGKLQLTLDCLEAAGKVEWKTHKYQTEAQRKVNSWFPDKPPLMTRVKKYKWKEDMTKKPSKKSFVAKEQFIIVTIHQGNIKVHQVGASDLNEVREAALDYFPAADEITVLHVDDIEMFRVEGKPRLVPLDI
jgi:hypothetical protein